MKHLVSICSVLAVFWLGNSGHYTGLLLVLGGLSIALVAWIGRRMDVIDHESQPLHLIGRKLPAYYLWLVGQVVRSNLDVVARIWRGNKSISPTVAKLPMDQKSDMGRVIYANSITLTPGTVAMELDGDQVLVHALSRAGIEELKAGEMNRRVANLESE